MTVSLLYLRLANKSKKKKNAVLLGALIFNLYRVIINGWYKNKDYHSIINLLIIINS